MRGKDTHPFVVWIGILLLIVLLAALAGGSVALRGESAPTATPLSAPTATASSTPSGPLLSDSRGFITVPGIAAAAEIRRETDPAPISALRGQGFIGAVSGTGRRVAYWVSGADGATRDLRVLDVTAPDQDTTLATVLDTERGAAVVWSSDRSGLVVVVESSGQAGTGEAPGPFSALRVVDTPTRSIHEISRLTDGSQYWPVAWDRVTRLVGACAYGGADAMGIAWVVVGEDALTSRVPMETGIPAITIRASGNDVLGVLNGSVLRVWSLASYNDHREFGAAAGEHIAFARWRPGADEIVVLVADRLELWPKAGGDRRVVARGLPAANDLLVSSDGALAFVTFDGGASATAVDLATGRSAPLPMSGSRLAAPISFR
ncbi:MAG TPA: hypothetical protein VIP07_07310 [Candidatus Limnocylindria bacterium]